MTRPGAAKWLRTAWLAASLLVAAPACESLRQGANPELPLWVHRPGSVLSLLQHRQITAEGRNLDEAYERGRPAIDPRNRRIFVGSSDHGLYALRADDGAPIWRFETVGAVQCEPLYDSSEDVVYFGSNDGALYKVRAENGHLLWRFMTNAEVERRPILHRGLLYFVNANDTLIAADPETGAMKWNQHRPPIGGMSIAGYGGAAAYQDRILVAFSDGHVAAFDASDGTPLWQPVDLSAEAEESLGYQVPKYFDVDTTPIVTQTAAGPVAIVASYTGGLFALDTSNGAQVWSNPRVTGVTDLTLWTQPAHRSSKGGPEHPARKVLIASSGTSGVWGLNPEDGTELWRRPLPEGGISAPAMVAGAMLVSTTRHGLFLMSPLDGKVIDGIDLGMGFAMAPAGHGTRAYVMSNGGAMLLLQVAPPG
jgi:outer membrane protein assembly factor BamB